MIVSPAPYQTEQEGNAVSVARQGLGEIVPFNQLYNDPQKVFKKILQVIEDYENYRKNVLKIRKILINLKGLNKLIDLVVGE